MASCKSLFSLWPSFIFTRVCLFVPSPSAVFPSVLVGAVVACVVAFVVVELLVVVAVVGINAAAGYV